MVTWVTAHPPLEGLIFSDKAIMISGRRSVILKIKTCHFGIWHRMAWPKATNPCYNECTKFASPRSFFFSIPSSNMFDFREWITRWCNSWLWKWDIYSQKLKTHEDTCETRENQACSKQKGFMAESERHNPRGHWRRTTPPMRWWHPWHLTIVEHMAVSRHPKSYQIDRHFAVKNHWLEVHPIGALISLGGCQDFVSVIWIYGYDTL